MEKFNLEINGKKIEVELSDLAEKANGSCQIRYGDTVVLATVVMADQKREGRDFFPLSVEYQERFYAAGKILGSRFIRRESRPSDEAVLTARLIDRAIRPRFPKGLKKEVQVVVTCLSWDRENDPDLQGLLASSVALNVSDIPWQGPVAIVRIGGEENQFILNPTYEEREKSNFELTLAAVEKDGEILINMIEAKGQEIKEEIFLKAVDFAIPCLRQQIDFQKKITEKMGKKKEEIPLPSADPELEKEMKEFLGNRLEKALYEKSETTAEDLKEELANFIEGQYPGEGKTSRISGYIEREVNWLIHKNVLEKNRRPDGRKLDQIREISCQAGILPRTHGSGLFQRGETKSLSILTLGGPTDARLIEGMEFIGKKRFMHHYNFPPYCAGEIKPFRGPGRREIGHGMLAERALLPLIPDSEEFPYTIRVVTEILSSNGSTSMASVCSSAMALMDAGVPIKRGVAGIALGLIMKEGSASKKREYKILTDIQGPEDHHGDMDLKVAGTKEGVTAVQMDVKTEGIDKEIFKEALERGKKARLQILEKIEKVIPGPRKELSPWAPRVYILQIKPEKIREVIGPGGKVIHEITEECGVTIDIEDSGRVFITSEKEEAAKKAVSWVKNITREVKVGEVFQGKVKKIVDFGAFLEILPGKEGLVHISQMAPYRVNKVEDIIRVGDVVPVKVISVDEQGKISLSMKEVRDKNTSSRQAE